MTEQSREVAAAVTMPLLTRITQQSLDADYLHVAARRRTAAQGTGGEAADASDASASSAARRPLTVVAVVAFGLLVAVAAVQTSRDAPTREASRAVLISRIDDRQAVVRQQHQRIAELTDENTNAESAYATLGNRLTQATHREQSLAQLTGFGPVSGSGVQITVDDTPGAGRSGMVQDDDLAGVLNGLWSAGATAISINGQRVTARSAPRNSGTVIRINNVSLTAPYVVSALGDNRTLLAKFAETESGRAFHLLTSTIGMPVTMENVDQLQIPAAPVAGMQLRSAHAVTGKKPQEEN